MKAVFVFDTGDIILALALIFCLLVTIYWWIKTKIDQKRKTKKHE